MKKIEQFAKKFTLFLEILQIVCPVFLATRMAMMMVGVKMTMKMNLWSLVMKK